MGADAFHIFYGVRWEIDSSSENEIALLQQQQDSRQLSAKKHELDSWWGVTTNQSQYFLLVGKLVSSFGWEGEDWVSLQDAELSSIVEKTKKRLSDAAIDGVPAWHYQFEPDY